MSPDRGTFLFVGGCGSGIQADKQLVNEGIITIFVLAEAGDFHPHAGVNDVEIVGDLCNILFHGVTFPFCLSATCKL